MVLLILAICLAIFDILLAGRIFRVKWVSELENNVLGEESK